jgi:hypothetical protein
MDGISLSAFQATIPCWTEDISVLQSVKMSSGVHKAFCSGVQNPAVLNAAMHLLIYEKREHL